MKLKFKVTHIVFLFVLLPAVIFASSMYQQLKFDIEHSNCPEIRKAGRLLIDSGVISPSSMLEVISGLDSHSPDSRLIFNEAFIQQALKRDIIKQQVPSELKEINLHIVDNFMQVRGRLDGPLFINPSFTLDLRLYLTEPNRLSVKASNIRVSRVGFKVSMFYRLLSNYMQDAFSRAFPANCTAVTETTSDGIIIHLEVDPEGILPGLSEYGYLSNAGMANGCIFFTFSLPD